MTTQDGKADGIVSGKSGYWIGLDLPTDSGITGQIPRVGLKNPTIHRVVSNGVTDKRGAAQARAWANTNCDAAAGTCRETEGEVVAVPVSGGGSLQWVEGAVSHFGGPTDINQGETLPLAGVNCPRNTRASLNNASCKYYIAMRFNYEASSSGVFRKFWTERKLLVRNPENNKCVVTHALSWGPAPGLNKRFADLSYPAYKAIGTRTDANVQVAFAADDAPAGPAACPTQASAGGGGSAASSAESADELRDYVTVLGYGESATGEASARINAQSTDPQGNRAARFILAVALPEGEFGRLRNLDVGESGMSLLQRALTSPAERPLGDHTSWMRSEAAADTADAPLLFFGAAPTATRLEAQALRTPASMPGRFGHLAVYFFRVLSDDGNTESAPALLERLRKSAAQSAEDLATEVVIQSRLTKSLSEAPALTVAAPTPVPTPTTPAPSQGTPATHTPSPSMPVATTPTNPESSLPEVPIPPGADDDATADTPDPDQPLSDFDFVRPGQETIAAPPSSETAHTEASNANGNVSCASGVSLHPLLFLWLLFKPLLKRRRNDFRWL